MTDSRSAFDSVHFNEYDDCLDMPYVVRALESFNVNKLDDDGIVIEDEFFHVEKGSTWEIYSPSYSGNDVYLEGDDGSLDLNWDDLKMFEVVEEGGYYE